MGSGGQMDQFEDGKRIAAVQFGLVHSGGEDRSFLEGFFVVAGVLMRGWPAFPCGLRCGGTGQVERGPRFYSRTLPSHSPTTASPLSQSPPYNLL